MGFTPTDIDNMELCRFFAAYEGFRKANSPEEEPPAPSEERYAQILEEQGH